MVATASAEEVIRRRATISSEEEEKESECSDELTGVECELLQRRCCHLQMSATALHFAPHNPCISLCLP